VVLSNELDVTSEVVFLLSWLGPEFGFIPQSACLCCSLWGNAGVNCLEETHPTRWQLATCKWVAKDERDIQVLSSPSSSLWQCLFNLYHSWEMLIQSLPVMLDSVWHSRLHKLSCGTFSLLPNLSLSCCGLVLTKQWGTDCSFSLSQLLHVGRLSLFSLPEPKQADSFVPPSYFWLHSMTLVPSLGLLNHMSGSEFP